MAAKEQGTHGAIRGLDAVPASPMFEGRFGRMFRTLTAAVHDRNDLRNLAQAMVAPGGDNTPEDQVDDEESTAISAGYTYFGQFIDHDLTFDPQPLGTKINDPDGLTDFRTPRFDLDCVYGRGPDDQPYLYDQVSPRNRKMLLGRPLTGNPNDPNAQDVQRNAQGRALIGDPRNDENVIVSQLQATMIRFHNRVVDVMPTANFRTVQQTVRWHYQWAVLRDFLPMIIGQDTLDEILPHIKKGTTIIQDPPKLHFYRWEKEPYIPIEFAVAAYRFGHSMVRPIYRLSRNVPRFDIFSANPNSSLTGFREFPSNWGIEWNLFFMMAPQPTADAATRVQPAYKIDSSLVNPLGQLPPSIVATVPSLAERNLIRGLVRGLPSGQAVARRMGIPVVPDDALKVGKATEADSNRNLKLVDISANFKDNAPLWFYILSEAQQAFKSNASPIRLGKTGGRLVGEVFVGLLLADHNSFLFQDTTWRPRQDFLGPTGTFGIPELISQALKAT